ncbi:MAG: hypothetical protein NTX82_03900 [Candidatus Parcubacteria bacterium]|nr:hypothetical protein [Candidatus Parcubacteria bacterium]
MSVAARKIEFKGEPSTVVQYWLCVRVEAEKREHVYFLEDGWYAVTGYIGSETDAVRMCSEGKCVAEVVVHEYTKCQLHAHKKNITFKRWVLIRPVKAPA